MSEILLGMVTIIVAWLGRGSRSFPEDSASLLLDRGAQTRSFPDSASLLLDRDVRFFLSGQTERLRSLRDRRLFVLEIGVAVGQNGNYLLSRYPNLHYTGIDPYIAPEVRERYGAHFDEKRYDLFPEKSEDIVDRFPDGKFDLVFVDGPHTYKNVHQDILNYSRKVKPGGILAGHDFTCVHPPLLWGVSDKRLWGGVINYGMDGVWWWTAPAGSSIGEIEDRAHHDRQRGGDTSTEEL